MEKKPFVPGPRRDNNGPSRRGGNAPKDLHAINERIRAREVRLVGDNVETGIYPIQEALKIAEAQGLDLIEISPNAAPPVCKVLDYQKFLYQQKKHQKEQKAKATKVVVKEIRFGPQTDDHDYNFKLKHAIGFLQDAPSFSRNRARCFCSVSPTTLRSTAKLSRCRCSRVSA